MQLSEFAHLLRRSNRARLTACLVLIVVLAGFTSLVTRLAPVRYAAASQLLVLGAHAAFWTVWIALLAFVLTLRQRLLGGRAFRATGRRVTLELACLGAYVFIVSQVTGVTLEHTIGIPELPNGVEVPIVPLLAMRGAFVYGVAFLALVSLRSFAHTQERERAIREKERLEVHLAQAQLQALRAQVRPHFLFNSLHAIGGLVLEEENERAHRAILALATLLRSTFRNDEDSTVEIAREMELIEEYLALEKLRLADRMDYEFIVENEARHEHVPPLLLLPVVENAVRHGIAPKPSGGRVSVAVRHDGPDVVMSVVDDGVGFEHGVPSAEGAGVGLVNCSERLRNLYGDRGRLQIEGGPDRGTRVTIRLPRSSGAVALGVGT